MKKVRFILQAGFGIFLGLTFPEQINDAIVFVKGVDYAGLYESAKSIGMQAYDLGASAVEAIAGLIKGDEAAA